MAKEHLNAKAQSIFNSCKNHSYLMFQATEEHNGVNPLLDREQK